MPVYLKFVVHWEHQVTRHVANFQLVAHKLCVGVIKNGNKTFKAHVYKTK